MRKFEDLKKEGYKGQDVCLDVSLFEHGLIWKEDGEDFRFIYGVNGDSSEYILFDWGNIRKDVDPKKEWDWVEDWNDILSFTGMSEGEFLSMPLPYIVADLVSYYGHENIFGDSYHPFKIEKED